MEITNFEQISFGIIGETTPPTTSDEGFDVSDTYIHKLEFSIKNISVAFANSLRRSFSTLCPTVTLDHDNINIIENTTSLHNEFIIHRLELLPIDMDNRLTKKVFKLKTFYNKDTHKREWEFLNSEEVPKFIINTNLSETVLTDNISMNNIKNITTDSFIVKIGDTKYSGKTFFKKDVFTKLPILVNCLKADLYSDTTKDNLHFNAEPVPGLGKHSARNDPTGTVEYKFKLDTDEKITKAWEKKLEYLNKERELSGLTPYTEKEISQKKSTFDLLDKYRVYETNKIGEANHFEFGIESIGFMSANRIVYDSVKHLELCISDIIDNIQFKVENTDANLYMLDKSYSEKLLYKKLTNINKGCSITIRDENHTLGNLIQSVIRKLYLIDRDNLSDTGKYLKIANYRMNHPTIEEIEIILVPIKSLSKDIIDSLLNQYIKETYSVDGKIKINNNNRILYFSIYLFIQALIAIKKDIVKFLEEFSAESGITEASYDIIS